jgi:hypothetical protein
MSALLTYLQAQQVDPPNSVSLLAFAAVRGVEIDAWSRRIDAGVAR